MSTIEKIKSSEVYQQILKESFGGVLYDVANHGKYDTVEIMALWNGASPSERESAGGIMKGAFNFIEKRGF